jgi:hypothetical protein
LHTAAFRSNANRCNSYFKFETKFFVWILEDLNEI